MGLGRDRGCTSTRCDGGGSGSQVPHVVHMGISEGAPRWGAVQFSRGWGEGRMGLIGRIRRIGRWGMGRITLVEERGALSGW